MTSDPSWNKCPRKVEKRLYGVCVKIKETEVKADFFRQMVKDGVTTADVRNFVEKQAQLKRVNQYIHAPTAKQAMKAKLSDTVALLGGLRKSKKELVDDLIIRFSYPQSKCRNLIKSYMKDAAYHKERQITRLSKKFKHCKTKMKLNKEKNDYDMMN